MVLRKFKKKKQQEHYTRLHSMFQANCIELTGLVQSFMLRMAVGLDRKLFSKYVSPGPHACHPSAATGLALLCLTSFQTLEQYIKYMKMVRKSLPVPPQGAVHKRLRRFPSRAPTFPNPSFL